MLGRRDGRGGDSGSRRIEVAGGRATSQAAVVICWLLNSRPLLSLVGCLALGRCCRLLVA